jgi:hypothetical protein
MAVQSLNSVGGFSVLDNTGNISIVIDSNGNVTTPVLTVVQQSYLGDIGNVQITGGANGFLLQTDGTGNLSWANPSVFGQGLMPFYIPINTTYTISQYQQGLFSLPITVEGTLEVDGILVQV